MLIPNRCSNIKRNLNDLVFKNFLMVITMMNQCTRLRREMAQQAWSTHKLQLSKMCISQDLVTTRLSVVKSHNQWWAAAIKTLTNNFREIEETKCLQMEQVPTIIINRKINGRTPILARIQTRIKLPLLIKSQTIQEYTDHRYPEQLQLRTSTVPTIGKLPRILLKRHNHT